MRSYSRSWLLAGVLGVGVLAAGATWFLWSNDAVMFHREQPATAELPQSRPAEFDFSMLPTPRPLPTLTFLDRDGASKSLADFKGRVVLLNIWATWCVPCRAEMPALDRLQAKLGGQDFEVVALSIDRKGLDVVKPFYAELGLQALGVYIDRSGDAAHALETVGVPTTLLIDREGRELGRKLGPAEWDQPAAVALIQRAIEGTR